MTEVSKSLSIIAYYLSEYDTAAVQALGFKTHTAAFKEISVLFKRDNHYLKLRRDEFDALPNSSSHRNGFSKRPPAQVVLNIAAYLKTFSFEEITELVKSIIAAQAGALMTVLDTTDVGPQAREYSEAELENLINFEDPNATVKVKTSPSAVRAYNTLIIRQLKKLYKGKCQLCGCEAFPSVACDLIEVHHIDYFAVSHNNNASNLIALCPNHHRLIHKLNPRYDADQRCYIYPDGTKEAVKLNYHL